MANEVFIERAHLFEDLSSAFERNDVLRYGCMQMVCIGEEK